MSGHEPASSEPTYRRPRPNPVLQFLFRVPVYLYWGPVAHLLAWRCVLRLTTVGRRTGRLRRTCVSFMPLDGNYVVFAGWGVVAHWYQNLMANPRVKIDVGARTMNAVAYPVRDPDQRRSLMLRMSERSRRCGPPRILRPLLSWIRAFDYDREIRLAVEHASEMPVIELVPEGQQPLAGRNGA